MVSGRACLDQQNLIDEKTGDIKSRDSVPLIKMKQKNVILCIEWFKKSFFHLLYRDDVYKSYFVSSHIE